MWPYTSALELACFLERYADLEPPAPRWLSDDASDSFCPRCVDAAAAERNAEIDGGFSGGESDHCEHCERCGALLHYSLTDYGALSELEHYRQFLSWVLPPSRDDAYHMARMLYALPESEEAAAAVEPAVVAILRTQP